MKPWTCTAYFNFNSPCRSACQWYRESGCPAGFGSKQWDGNYCDPMTYLIPGTDKHYTVFSGCKKRLLSRMTHSRTNIVEKEVK